MRRKTGMVHLPNRLSVKRRPLSTRDPTFAIELNRPASIRLLRWATAAARGPISDFRTAQQVGTEWFTDLPN
jgi:hypothetical protein